MCFSFEEDYFICSKIMSSVTIKLWEVYCTNEELYKRVWSTTQPTTCPDNNSHSISINPGPKILNSISEKKVKIVEEDGLTQGIYKLHGFTRNIPSGNVGNVSSFVHTWKYPITLSNGWFISTNEMEGDIIDCVVAENLTIGVITAPVNYGDSILSVSPTVIPHLYNGYTITITDGVNTDKLGEVTELDSANNIVIVENTSTHSYSPLSPTYVNMGVKVIENFGIPIGKQRYAFAEKKIGGKYIPKDIPVVVKYTNNSGNAKTFIYNMEYLY